MSKPSLIQRAQAAIGVFKEGYPGGAKQLPWSWTKFRQLQPLWHLVDFQSYVNEGFSANSLIYSAIMYKVRAVITAPLRAYSGDPYYPTPLPPTAPLAQLVAQPNEHQSWNEFHSQNVVYLNLDGNVFIYKHQDLETGRERLYSLRPDRVFIVPTDGMKATVDHFVYVPEGKNVQSGYPMLIEDMIHIKLPYPGDPLEGMGYGLSPLSSAAKSADVDNMVTDFLNLFFQRGAMLTGVLSFDQPLKEDIVDIILERWEKKYGGYKKWSTGVLDRGGTYERTGLTFEEMGFNELDARNECRILGPFGVPPILIGSRVGLERSTYSNYEGARKAVWEDTLVPELKLFEVEYQRHLNTPDAFVKFDTTQVPALQKDLPVIVNAAYSLWQMGVPANQATASVGLRIGAIPGGDEPFGGKDPSAGAQGPRANPDQGWGMRSLTCEDCGTGLKLLSDQKILICETCRRAYA